MLIWIPSEIKNQRRRWPKRGRPHKAILSKGGSNSKRNLRIVSRKTNRRKGAKYNAGGGKYKGGKRIK